MFALSVVGFEPASMSSVPLDEQGAETVKLDEVTDNEMFLAVTGAKFDTETALGSNDVEDAFQHTLVRFSIRLGDFVLEG